MDLGRLAPARFAVDSAFDSLAPDPASRNGSTSRSTIVTIQRLVVVGYITAVAMPPIGLVLGIVLTLRARVKSRHGPWIVLASVIGTLIWALLISSGALTATNQGY
jgi:hypothetical protein